MGGEPLAEARFVAFAGASAAALARPCQRCSRPRQALRALDHRHKCVCVSVCVCPFGGAFSP